MKVSTFKISNRIPNVGVEVDNLYELIFKTTK